MQHTVWSIKFFDDSRPSVFLFSDVLRFPHEYGNTPSYSISFSFSFLPFSFFLLSLTHVDSDGQWEDFFEAALIDGLKYDREEQEQEWVCGL
jgi:hypothetical protein